MRRLVFMLWIVPLVVSCEREQRETDVPSPADTAAPDTADEITPPDTSANAFSAEQWIRAGEPSTVRSPNEMACLHVPAASFPVGYVEGDSLRIRIQPGPPELPPAFQKAPGTVFTPRYEFAALDAAGQEVTEFADSVTVAICARYDYGQEPSIDRAVLARPDPRNPGSLQFFRPVEPPAECEMNPVCKAQASEGPAQQALSPRGWLDGSPLTPTPVYAQCATCFRGISGGGPGNSLFAAVDTTAAGGAMEAEAE